MNFKQIPSAYFGFLMLISGLLMNPQKNFSMTDRNNLLSFLTCKPNILEEPLNSII